MKIKFELEINWPRWFGPRARRALPIAVLVVLLVVPLAALASDLFVDVPSSARYHDAVDAVYRARVMLACQGSSDPATRKFCPSATVERADEAQALNRGLGRVAYVYRPTGVLMDALKADRQISSLAITSGGGNDGGTGFIKIDASVSAWNAATDGCPCEIELWLTDATTGAKSNAYWVTVGNAVGGAYSNQSAAVTWVEAVPTATARTFVLHALQFDGTVNRVDVRGDISAIYAPFGSTGRNTLGAGASAPNLDPAGHR